MLLETVPVLVSVWYLLIAVLWIGFFFLECFDFGVALHLKVTARSDKERRVMINTIGPLWDGNEVWLITASPVELAQPLADRLGLTGVVATQPEQVDGYYTGRLEGDLLHGQAGTGETVIMSSTKAITTYRDKANTGAGELKASSTASGGN